MVRFIFICMAVVAVAIATTAAQFMIDGIDDARQAVTARNTETPAPVQTQAAIVTAPEEPVSAEALNAIDTAAGGDDFGAGFSNQAPKGLEDDTAPAQSPVPLNALDTAAE